MANKLHIYACSGLGNTNASSEYDYWLDNNQVITNTQAVNSLITYIDTNYTDLMVESVTKAQKIAMLNEIDLYSVCLFYAQEYSGDTARLRTIGRVIGSLNNEGLFSFNSLDNTERDLHLDSLFEAVIEAEKHSEDYNGDSEFDAWWDKTVIQRDKVGMTVQEQNRFIDIMTNALKKSGIGAVDDSWKENETLAKYLDKSGNYFLYLFFDKSEMARLPKVFADKANEQKRLYDVCKGFFVNVYGSESDMQEVIRNGIKREYHMSPEMVCKKIASGEIIENVGFVWTVADIIALIEILAPLIVALITGIIDYCKNKDAGRYQSISDKVVEQNVPHADDFKGMEYKDSGIDSKWLIGAAIAGIVLLLFKKNN